MKESDLKKFDIPLNQKPHGLGSERTVFTDPKSKGRVIAIEKSELSREEQYRARIRYHLIKIMHMLFPDNIPDIHFSYSKPNAVSRDKVELGAEHDVVRKYQVNEKYDPQSSINEDPMNVFIIESKISSYAAVKELNSALRTSGFLVDSAGRNFGFNEKGIPQFVDAPLDFKGTYNLHAIKRAIEQKLNGLEQHKALLHLNRLMQASGESLQAKKEELVPFSPKNQAIKDKFAQLFFSLPKNIREQLNDERVSRIEYLRNKYSDHENRQAFHALIGSTLSSMMGTMTEEDFPGKDSVESFIDEMVTKYSKFSI